MLGIFKKIQGYNSQLALDFAENFITKSINMKGHKIPITIDSISEFTGLSKIGKYLNKRDHYAILLSIFHPINEPKVKIYIT